MRTLLVSLAIFGACAVPSAAQVMGSANKGKSAPPVVLQTIESADQRVSLTYHAITWAEGKFMDKLGNERFRNYLNSQAEQRPIGSFSTNVPLTVAGKTVAPGKYALAFNVDAKARWHLVLTAKDEAGAKIDWALRLRASDARRSRLRMALSPGAKAGHYALDISFGGKVCPVTAKPASRPTSRGSDN